MAIGPILRFGPFELRSRTKELYRGGIRLKLRPQPFQVLRVLLENAGEVVSREELRNLLWPSDTFVDFEHGLNSSVKELRGILGDSVRNPRYIETLPKIGYRFLIAVENAAAVPGSLEDQATAEAETATLQSLALPSNQPSGQMEPREEEPANAFSIGRKWSVPLATCAILVAVFGLLYFRGLRAKTIAKPATQRMMLAVLPFQNLTGDPAQEYVTDGFTDEIIANLGRVDPKQLAVIGRTSVMRYKHSGEPIPKIGKELGVQYVLEGSVRSDSSRIRVTAELIRTSDEQRLWTHEYDRAKTSLIEIQQEIAQQTSDGIFAALGTHPEGPGGLLVQPASGSNYEAYLHYLRGRYFWNKRSSAGFQQAINEFQEAIAKDPSYARAYAGLADSYSLTTTYGLSSASEYMPKAREAALHAIALDPSLAEAHTSLASIAQSYDWDWQAADKEYKRAIELDPNYATAHHWYAESLAFRGRFDEAFAEMETARELDPLSLIIGADYGAVLYFARKYDAAIQQFRIVLDMEPRFGRAHMIDYAFAQTGRYSEAIEDVERWRQQEDAAWAWPMEVYVFGRWGKVESARKAMGEMTKRGTVRYIEPSAFLVANIGLGNDKEALTWLERACARRSQTVTAIKVDPIYDPLRNDPRFQAILKQVALDK